MATLASALRGFVLLDPAVTALIGEHIHWNRVPEGVTPPYVRALIVTDSSVYNQMGAGPAKAVVQFDGWDSSKATVDDVMTAIKARTDGYRGSINGWDVRIFITNERDSWDQDLQMFHRMLEMEVGYV